MLRQAVIDKAIRVIRAKAALISGVIDRILLRYVNVDVPEVLVDDMVTRVEVPYEEVPIEVFHEPRSLDPEHGRLTVPLLAGLQSRPILRLEGAQVIHRVSEVAIYSKRQDAPFAVLGRRAIIPNSELPQGAIVRLIIVVPVRVSARRAEGLGMALINPTL